MFKIGLIILALIGLVGTTTHYAFADNNNMPSTGSAGPDTTQSNSASAGAAAPAAPAGATEGWWNNGWQQDHPTWTVADWHHHHNMWVASQRHHLFDPNTGTSSDNDNGYKTFVDAHLNTAYTHASPPWPHPREFKWWLDNRGQIHSHHHQWDQASQAALEPFGLVPRIGK